MDIFIRLVLAHLLGDYVLQTEKVYAMKHSGAAGIFAHAAIVILCFIVMMCPYWENPLVWGFIAFNFAAHFLQDVIKLKLEGRSRYPVYGYCVDQALHILTISLLFYTDLKNLPLPAAGTDEAIALYNNNTVILYCIALITVTYAGHWFIVALKSSYFRSAPVGGEGDQAYGMLERGLMLTIMMFVPYGKFISPLVLCGRVIFPGMRERPSRELDMILSGVTGIVAGMAFSLINQVIN